MDTTNLFSSGDILSELRGQDYDSGRFILSKYGYRETQKSSRTAGRVTEIAAKFVHNKEQITCGIRYRLVGGQAEYELIEWK